MFGLFASSRQKGAPVTIYRIAYGNLAGAVVLMTDSETPVVYNGETYLPVSIQHGNIVVAGTLDKAALTVTVPRNSSIAELFRVSPPTYAVSLTIMQGNVGDTDWRTVWFGSVKAIQYEGSAAKLHCEPLTMRMLHPGLRRFYQISCPHTLYGPLCKANKANFTFNGLVTAVVGQTITLATGWNGTLNISKFLTGYVQWGSPTQSIDARVILSVVDASNLLLAAVPTGVVAGQVVTIYPGCNHQPSDCQNLFNNINNFGGFPYIPVTNPTGLQSLISGS